MGGGGVEKEVGKGLSGDETCSVAASANKEELISFLLFFALIFVCLFV